MRSDLHVHTSCSDGLETPENIVLQSAEIGLGYLSITDHDTMAGYRRARRFLGDHPDISEKLTLIPGMEISSVAGERDVHMLAYFIDDISLELSSELEMADRRRADRSFAVADKLAEAGYPIDRSRLRESGTTVNRVTIARILVEEGSVTSVGEAFRTLIGKGCPYYVDRGDIDARHAIKLILARGGIPVMAHPAL